MSKPVDEKKPFDVIYEGVIFIENLLKDNKFDD